MGRGKASGKPLHDLQLVLAKELRSQGWKSLHGAKVGTTVAGDCAGRGPHPLRIPCSAREGATAGLGWTVEDRGVLGGGQGHSCLPTCVSRLDPPPRNAAQLESSLSEGVAHFLPQLVLKPGEPRKPGSNSDHRLSLGKSVTFLEPFFPLFDF